MGSWGSSVAGILQGFGQMTSGYAQAYQMQEEERLAGYQVTYELQAAEVEEADFRETANTVIGKGVAETGASGFDASVGSAADAINSLIRRRELDAAAIRHGGKVAAWAANEERKALKYGARTTKIGAHFAGAGAVAQGIGGAWSWWQGRKGGGGWGGNTWGSGQGQTSFSGGMGQGYSYY